MSVVFDILSLNTAGIGDSIKRHKLFNYAKKHTSSAGIVFLQKTHSSGKNERLWVDQWGCGRDAVIFSHGSSHGSSNARGVLNAFRESLGYKILSVTHDRNGRFIIINTIIKGSPIILINYYAPNDKNGQFQVLNEIQGKLDLLDRNQDTQIIWDGDFNVIFDTKLEADGGTLN